MNSYITLLHFLTIIHCDFEMNIRVYYFQKPNLRVKNLFEGNLEQLKEFLVYSYPSENNKYLYFQVDYFYTKNNTFQIVLRDNAYDFKENL